MPTESWRGVKLEPVSGVFVSRRQRTAFSKGDRSP